MLAPLAAAVGEFARRQATGAALEIVAVSAIWALIALLGWGAPRGRARHERAVGSKDARSCPPERRRRDDDRRDRER